MLQAIKNILLNQELKKANSVKQFVDWASAKKICVMLPNHAGYLNVVKTFVAENHKEIDIILFHHDKVNVTKDVFLSLNKKNFNWMEMPKSETIQRIRSKEYDILINCDLKGEFVFKSLTAFIKAKCIVGSAELPYSKLFDISISEKNSDFGNFLKQALKYLNMIKAN